MGSSPQQAARGGLSWPSEGGFISQSHRVAIQDPKGPLCGLWVAIGQWKTATAGPCPCPVSDGPVQPLWDRPPPRRSRPGLQYLAQPLEPGVSHAAGILALPPRGGGSSRPYKYLLLIGERGPNWCLSLPERQSPPGNVGPAGPAPGPRVPFALWGCNGANAQACAVLGAGPRSGLQGPPTPQQGQALGQGSVRTR